jgi:hypothetical protein
MPNVEKARPPLEIMLLDLIVPPDRDASSTRLRGLAIRTGESHRSELLGLLPDKFLQICDPHNQVPIPQRSWHVIFV